MKKFIVKIRKLIPNSVVNYCLHFPKALLASMYYGFPAKRLKIIGVTGTDGKTTTVNMIYNALKKSGYKVSMISTIYAEVAGVVLDTGLHTTTPTVFALQRLLRKAVEKGDQYLVLEVTSHSIAQFRVYGLEFEVGVITNITQEHLDYHSSFEEYVTTKMKLLFASKVIVANNEDDNVTPFLPKFKQKVITFGLQKSANYSLDKYQLRLKMPGQYNQLNALAALAVCTQLKIKQEMAIKSLESFTGLEGRLEEIKASNNFRIFVDFAHTPNSIRNVLKTLRNLTPKNKKLIAVFGASAERDEIKRPIMGQVASEFADVIILTDDDPRFEDRKEIMKQIATGINSSWHENKNLFFIPDRDLAIAKACKISNRADVVALLGKGHEKSMSYLGTEFPWSDQVVVREILAKKAVSMIYSGKSFDLEMS